MNFSFDTHYTDDAGNEHDIRVDYDYQPAEYENGFERIHPSINITAAWFEDHGDVIEDIPYEEYHRLEQRCWEDYRERGEREADKREAMLEDAAEARAEYLREMRNDY